MYVNNDQSITVQLKDYSKLLSVLSKHDYWDSYFIKTFCNKHDGLYQLLKNREVLEFIIQSFNPAFLNSTYTIIRYKELHQSYRCQYKEKNKIF